jgi:outer membrane autotransporter protein
VFWASTALALVSTPPAGASQAMQYWDGGNTTPNGVVDGGSGNWTNGVTNWTNADGTMSQPWLGWTGVFQGAFGTISVVGTQGFDTLRFLTDEYHINSGNLAFSPASGSASTIFVDNGVTTIIDSTLVDGTATGFAKTGNGTLVLTAANTYTGDTSLLGGTLSVASDDNLGIGGGLIFDGGVLRVTGKTFTGTTRAITWGAAGGGFDIESVFNTFTVSQSLNGSGGLTKLGEGTLVLSGINGYSGGTTISRGLLSVTVTGALGSGPVQVGTNSALDFETGTSAGSLRLTTAASPGIGVNGGSILFKDGSSADHAQIVIGSGGGVGFHGSSTAAAAQFDNSGTVDFWHTSDAGQATILNHNDASTNFVDDSSAGNAQITNAAGGAVDFFDNSTAGNATIINNGGYVVFRNTTSAGSSSIINGNGGRVLLRTDADASGAKITNNAGGIVDLSRVTSGIAIGALSGAGNVLMGSKTLTLGGLGGSERIDGILQDGGVAGGTGASLVKTGAGTLTLAGANTYTGSTTIKGGILQIGNGGTSGSVAGAIVNNGTLAFNRSDTASFANVISGNGSIRQIGSGMLKLSGDSSGFSGSTIVENGILSVDGKLGGTIDVLAGGRLQGNGTIGLVTIAGTIAPGNSVGTLNIAGDVVLATGSTYEVEIAGNGTSDRIVATGKATLGGGKVAVTALDAKTSYQEGQTYTILTAGGGITGSFDPAVLSRSAFLDATLVQKANAVDLKIALKADEPGTPGNKPLFAKVADTYNQKQTAGALDTLQQSGAPLALYNKLLVLSADEARSAFDSLSGEVNASTVTGLIEDSRFTRDAINDRLRSAFETVGAEPLPLMSYGDDAKAITTASVASERYGAWGSVFGSWGHFGGDGNAAKLSRSTGGFVTGVDGLVTDDVRLGFLAGYSHSSFKVDDRRSSASSDNYHLGIYGGTQLGALSLRSGLAYTWSEIDTSRQVAFPAFTDSLTGSYRAGTTQLFGELGYGIKAGSVAFEPFANLAYVNVHSNGFAEQGGASALTVHSGSNDNTLTTLGIRAATDFDIGAAKATVRGMIGWRHAYGDVTPTVSQAFTGSNAFTIAGAPIAKDAAVIEAGLDFAIAPQATLGVSYHGQVGSKASDHGVRADLNVKF